MAEVSVIVGGSKTSWEVSEPDGINLIGIFAEVIKGSEPTTTQLSDLTNIDELIEDLNDRQNEACAYGTREGDGRTCDCKYVLIVPGANPSALFHGENTGCCELRQAIRVLELLRSIA